MAVRIAPTVYDPEIESDGLTIDTARGPVDLVAVQRALDGHPIELTEAEWTYLSRRLGTAPTRAGFGYTDDFDARTRVREALDITPPVLSQRVVYRLRRDQITTARKAA
jgi:hypothetical protein